MNACMRIGSKENRKKNGMYRKRGNMKTSKKLLAFLLAGTMALTACGAPKTAPAAQSSSAKGSSEKESSQEQSSKKDDGKVTIDDNSLYLVTDLGTLDDKSFNQASYEGLTKFADEIGVKPNYVKPAGEGAQMYLQAVEQAVNAGAKIVVTPGYLFQSAIYTAQEEHPDVKFVAVDFEPQPEKGDVKVAQNTTSILFKEDQPGFMAGYAAVKDGYTKLGFMGGVAVPAVVRYGYGFVAGANQAAKEMNTKVEIKYNYTQSFVAKPEINTLATSWYKAGTEVIFSCGGGIFASILKAAQAQGGKVIGVDVNQNPLAEEVITSAMKNLTKSVYEACKSVTDGSFQGGKTQLLGVESDSVQLPDDFSRFKKFTKEDYNALYSALKEDKDGILSSIPAYDEGGDPSIFANKVPQVALTYVK